MRITYLFFVAVAFCCFAAPTANGQSILEPLLSFDGPVHHDQGIFGPEQGGGEDKLQDDSLDAWLDLDFSGDFSDGDIFVGQVNLTNISASGRDEVGVGEFFQIALVISTTISGTGSGGSIATVPTDPNSPYSLQSMLAGIPGIENLTSDSIGVMLSTNQGNSTGNINPDANGSNNPLNWDFNALLDDANGNAFANGNGGWGYEATVGLVNIDPAGDFGETSVAGPTLIQRAATTIQHTVFDNNGWISVDVLDFAGNLHFGDFTLDVGTFASASQDEQDRGWTFRDQSSFFLNPAPPTEDCDARTIGFWGNRHGLAIIAELDCLDDLAALNLRNQDGSDFDPTTLSQWRSWLRGANAENMAYMLSAQMAGMFLNIKAGFVGADDMVVVDGELLDISDVIDAANEVLGLDPIPDGDGLLELVSGHPDAEQPASDYVTPLAPFGEGTLREYAGFLKNILDDGNNNLNWEDCNPPAKFNMGGLEGLEGLDGLDGLGG